MAHKRREDDWKEKILRNYKCLVHDTQLYSVADECFSNNVIDAEERERISSIHTDCERNRHFINVLLRKSLIQYQRFLECLTDEFDWIKQRIEEAETDQRPPTPGPKFNDIRRKIFLNYDDLVKNTTIYVLSDDLISERILDISDWEKMCSESTTESKNKLVLDALLKNRSHGYTLLMKMLEQHGYCDLVSKINYTNVNENIDKEIEWHLRKGDDYREKSAYENQRSIQHFCWNMLLLQQQGILLFSITNARSFYMSVEIFFYLPSGNNLVLALRLIEQHREDDTFVQTPQVEKGIEILEEHGLLIYVGLPGDGKTKNAIAVMNHFQSQKSNYIFFNICDVKTFPSCVNLKNNNLFFLDNFLGSYMTYDDRKIEEKNTQYLAAVQSYVRSGNCKFILTLRNTDFAKYKEILKETKIYDKKWTVDLTSSKSKLTKEFKRQILECYFRKNNISICKKKSDENYKTAADIQDCKMTNKINVMENTISAKLDRPTYKTTAKNDMPFCSSATKNIEHGLKTADNTDMMWHKYTVDKDIPEQKVGVKKDTFGYRCDVTNDNSENKADAIQDSTLQKIAAINDFTKYKTVVNNDSTGFQIRISEKTVNKICETNSVIGFPQSCYIFSTKKCYTSLGLSYFKKPSKKLIRQIAKMVDMEATNCQKLQYCIMAYMLLNEGVIIPSKIDDGDELFEEVVHSVGLKRLRDFRDRDIQDKIHSLTDVYICMNEDSESFVFKHQTILESVALCFYDDNGELLLRHCSKAFIKDFIRPKTFKEKKGEIVLKIKEKHYNIMIDRFVNHIGSDRGMNRFKWWVGHPLFDHEKFVDNFCSSVQSNKLFCSLIQSCVNEGLLNSIDLFCQSYFAKQLRKIVDVPESKTQNHCKKEKLRPTRSVSEEANDHVTNFETKYSKTVTSEYHLAHHGPKTSDYNFKGVQVLDLQRTCYF